MADSVLLIVSLRHLRQCRQGGQTIGNYPQTGGNQPAELTDQKSSKCDDAFHKTGCDVLRQTDGSTPLRPEIPEKRRIKNCLKFGELQFHGRYQQFARDGIWTDILRIVAKGAVGKVHYIDGTHIRVHQAGANPAGGAQAHAIRKTKGGRNSKLLVMVDLKGRLVAMLLIPGQAYEGHHVVGLIQAANLPPGLTIVGDKAYGDDKLRFTLTELGFITCFPTKSNRKESRPMHRGHYQKRYRVENCFCRLKRWASVATRRDKLATRFLALTTFAAILDWLA